jgi:phosphate binding protein
MWKSFWMVLLGVIVAFSGCQNSSAPTSGTGAEGSIDESVAELGFMPEGAVCPEPAAISALEYPLSRPLFIYVNKATLKRPEMVAFLRHYVSDEGQKLLAKPGYSALNEADLKVTRDRLEAAVTEAAAEATTELQGTFKIDGSSTVFPVNQAVAETFMKEHPGVNVTVNYTGTGTGFKMLASGEVEIAGASRAIKSGELESCKANGIEVLEIQFGIDGLTVVVNQENTWVEGLSFDQLRQIWEPDSKVQTWSDLDPSWPAEKIVLCGPGDESGTFDYFTEAVVGEAKKSRKDYQSSPNDNTTVNVVSGNKYSLGYFGYAYLIENQDKVKPLCISK